MTDDNGNEIVGHKTATYNTEEATEVDDTTNRDEADGASTNVDTDNRNSTIEVGTSASIQNTQFHHITHVEAERFLRSYKMT